MLLLAPCGRSAAIIIIIIIIIITQDQSSYMYYLGMTDKKINYIN